MGEPFDGYEIEYQSVSIRELSDEMEKFFGSQLGMNFGTVPCALRQNLRHFGSANTALAEQADASIDSDSSQPTFEGARFFVEMDLSEDAKPYFLGEIIGFLRIASIPQTKAIDQPGEVLVKRPLIESASVLGPDNPLVEVCTQNILCQLSKILLSNAKRIKSLHPAFSFPETVALSL